MPFPFVLPTTSSVLLPDYYDSVTHPSLPLAATTHRSVLKDALKKYKRSSPSERLSNLPALQEAIAGYLPYLQALNAGSGYRDVGPEKLDIEVKKPLEVEWRSTLSAAFPGREPPRPKLVGLHNEVAFALTTAAYIQTQLARSQLRLLSGSAAVPSEQRPGIITAAIKHLLDAHSIHTYMLTLPSLSAAAAARDAPIDIHPSTISALASLSLSEANLTVVAKDDPYAAAVADSRNESNTDWMFKAPTIAKTRLRLLATICLAAAEHAATASGLFAQSAGKLDEDLVRYAGDLQRTARGKAMRFFALEADSTAKTGEALAWLQGARRALGLPAASDAGGDGDGRRKGLRGLKQTWQERREDRRVETRHSDWGADAGRLEEGRVVETLERKWERENRLVNIQAVPPLEPLLAGMPGGREFPHQIRPFSLPELDAAEFARLRAPLDPDEVAYSRRGGEEADSGDEAPRGAGPGHGAPAGAFPGTAGEYRSGTGQSYY
ncbi:uncharacterized protein K489DRAFT_408788 [Dissoconium aciculare CBS 342.82]|uniref:pH-response regulator protein palC n=1 Tax=Dissoconium aciculare CBS 342.82 TaxID=1314786 RepID=A0A6J3M970_9PEZI|nr:uncharacterized protein K489DRAFT_408788 [Dissoconium aciculare CBS 342.82]KAF1824408.1 hypothetical protein K489DRAFT_408788 [Dissoconium aciculare CBS 342.82]